MATTDFNEVFENLKNGVAALAKETVTGYISQATAAGQDALDRMKGDLQLWMAAVATGDMSLDDVKFLVAGRSELTEMLALQQLGIAQIQLDKFQSGLTDLIIGSIAKLL